jgi:hypothetical protein
VRAPREQEIEKGEVPHEGASRSSTDL